MELTPEEEERKKREADAVFQAQTAPSQLAMLQAQPGQVGGTNMMGQAPMGGLPLADRNALLQNPATSDSALLPSNETALKDQQAGLAETSSAPPPAEPAALPTPTIAPPAPAPVHAAGSGGGTASADAKSMKELAGVTAEQRAAAEQIGKANAGTAGAKADAATALATQQAESKAERSAALIAAQAEEKRLNAKAEAEDAKYKSMGFRDFFSNATIAGKPAGETAARIFGALSVALGAAGSSLTGGPNVAQQIIDKTIDREYQRQKDEILKQKDVVSEARGLAASAKAEKLVALEGWRKAAYEATLAQGNAMVAKMGPAGAEAEKAGVLAGISEKAMESEQAQKKGNAMIANTKADTALKGAEIGKVKAETVKDLAAAAHAGDPKDSERGIKDARQRAMLVTGLEDQDKVVRELEARGVRLDEKTLQRIQDNRTYLKAAEHGDKSALDALGIVYARKWGSVPRNEFDGLTAPEKRLAGAKSLMTQKAALLNAGAMNGEAISHAASQVDLLAPNLGPEEQERRQTYIRTDLIGANKGMIPGQAAKARSGAEAVQASAPAAPGRPGKVNGRPAIIHADGTYELVQ